MTMKATIPANSHSFQEQKQPTTNNDHNRTDNRETIQEANLQHPHTVKTNKKLISHYNMYTCVQFKQAHFHKTQRPQMQQDELKGCFYHQTEYPALLNGMRSTTHGTNRPMLTPIHFWCQWGVIATAIWFLIAHRIYILDCLPQQKFTTGPPG